MHKNGGLVRQNPSVFVLTKCNLIIKYDIMQNAPLILTYAIKNGRFSICATVKGTTKRNYKEIKTLVNPNFTTWDSKSQVFCELSDEAITNNQILFEIKRYYQDLIDKNNPTGKELFEYPEYDVHHIFLGKSSAQKANLNDENFGITLGAYLQQLIDEMKNPTSKVPSKNYQNYITLLHKLEIEGCIINMPIAKINDSHYEAFGNFLIRKFKGVNYKGLMKRFRTVINKARDANLTKSVLSYPYLEHMPKQQINFDRVINGVSVLTSQQYAKFVKLNLSKLPKSGPEPLRYMELYRDFCIFIYEMKMRPCDVVRLKYSDFRKGIMSIFNKKKMNYHDALKAIQTAPLTSKAKEIIEKYKGQSSKGYVFPFAMNEYDWNIYDPESHNKWYNKKQATFERINAFLKKVQVFLEIEEPLTMYTFRHTTFTHEINQGKKNILQIAKEGGTSVKMLEHHYYNHIKQ